MTVIEENKTPQSVYHGTPRTFPGKALTTFVIERCFEIGLGMDKYHYC